MDDDEDQYNNMGDEEHEALNQGKNSYIEMGKSNSTATGSGS